MGYTWPGLLGVTHSTFNIPIEIYPDSNCSFTKNDKIGKMVRELQFLVWDEVAMMNKWAIECVDRALKDLKNSTKPFGGVTVLFAGDFRQILPIVKHSNLVGQAAASLKKSFIWDSMGKFTLTQNVRLANGVEGEQERNQDFAKWLLKLGSGELQEEEYTQVKIDRCQVKEMADGVDFDKNFVTNHYKGVTEMIENRDWGCLTKYYAARCLITPLGKTVDKVNARMTDIIPGDAQVSISVDHMDEEGVDAVGPEILNSFQINGFPEHSLKLKVGMPLVLLRNLNLAQGLCNGTRLVIIRMSANALYSMSE